MPELPKIVRERLKVSTSALAHPDPNVLTAFAEHALSQPEHALVLEHLARCGDCRDVVVLSLPVIDTVPVTSSPSTSRSWLTWPVLRWGVVAAGVVVAVSVGILRYEQARPALRVASLARNEAADQGGPKSTTAPSGAQTQTSEETAVPSAKARVASKSLAARGAADAGATSQQLGHNANGRFAGTLADKATTTVELGSRSKPDTKVAAAEPSLDFNSAYAPKSPPQIAANQASAGAFRKSVPLPGRQGATVNVEAKSQADEVTVQGQIQDQLALNRPPDARDAEVAKAKPPVPMQSAAAPAPSSPIAGISPQAQQVVMLRALAPRWTISPSGDLQRSLDEGKTWQEVDVSRGVAGDRNFFVAREVVTVTDAKQEARAKAKETGKETGREKDKSLVFRAVAAICSQVWAGGSGSALYHSVDAGDHWTRVIPSASGVMLTGDVIGVEFSDTEHGKVTTSAPEVWTTSDGGVNWQKQ